MIEIYNIKSSVAEMGLLSSVLSWSLIYRSIGQTKTIWFLSKFYKLVGGGRVIELKLSELCFETKKLL